jgi:hypothetical protein
MMDNSMKSMFFRFLAATTSCLVLVSSVNAQSVVIDFEELTTFTGTPPAGSGQFFDGYSEAASSNGFDSRSVLFETERFGPGFSYSNVNNTTTPGFANFYAAFPGGGSAGDGSASIGSNYGLVATGSGATVTGAPDNGATVRFSTPSQLTSIDIANTTYAARFALDGLDGFDSMFNEAPDPALDFDAAAQFTDGDFFRLTFEGFDSSGSSTGVLSRDLANFGNAGTEDDFFLNDWLNIDLTSLGTVSSLVLSTSSSQNTDVGTPEMPVLFSDVPAFVAFDNLTFTSVPEPTCSLLFVTGAFCIGFRRRR